MTKLANRIEIDIEYKWLLTDIIKNDIEWEKLYNELAAKVNIIEQYEGKLQDEGVLLECLNNSDELSLVLEKLYSYAVMNKHTDESSTKYQGMSDRAEMLSVKFSTASSYIIPEITSFNKDRILDIASKKNFKSYAYTLFEIARNKDHILTSGEEKLLSSMGSFSGVFEDIFSMIDNVDIKWEPVTTDSGKEQMSHGRYSVFMQNPNRKIRKKAFVSMFSAYKGLINTIAATFGGSVKKDVFYAKARKYESVLQQSLNNSDIDPIVYDNLIKAVHKGQKSLHKYIGLRKKELGYKELHMYDMYVPIYEGADIKLPYCEACETVKKALMPLGADYQNKLNESFADGWIDVYENIGKRSGAYSWAVYGVHPFVLLNYQETTHDVFTIAHELGHAMHSYYSNEAQPHASSDYQIFVAEIASTVNEVLLLKYLIANTIDIKLKKYLLSYYLDMFRTTIFRQTMFSEFEQYVHGEVESDRPLTWDIMSDKYLSLNKEYYGSNVISDELIKFEWARIPHFYRAFYVYKYATGLTVAVAIAERLLSGDKKALPAYMEFLKAGGSMSPLDTLKLAGVDLTEITPFDYAMKVFDNTLEELAKL